MDLIQAQQISDGFFDFLKSKDTLLKLVGTRNLVLFLDSSTYENLCEALQVIDGTPCTCGCGNNFVLEEYLHPEYDYGYLKSVLNLELKVNPEWGESKMVLVPKGIPLNHFLQMQNAHLN